MIAIVDYDAGNLTSVRLAFETLDIAAEVTADPARIRAADRVVFPGVGAAGSAMRTLTARGLAPVIREVVARGTPFLGICLGTQIVLDRSEEDGGTAGLGILPGTVRRFRPASPFDKIPQMGWNAVAQRRPHPLFAGLDDNSEFYFVHSYYPNPADPDLVLGTTAYAGTTFASVLGRGALAATQFHPEKSGRIGLRMLRNFAAWTGETPC
jgi:imidazole glycerol-phosphate synthase subunit HisH